MSMRSEYGKYKKEHLNVQEVELLIALMEEATRLKPKEFDTLLKLRRIRTNMQVHLHNKTRRLAVAS